MIILAEYSNPRRSRYNQGILLARKNKNKKDVCYVLRVDKQKKNIDLSKKRIKREIAKEVEEKYSKGKKVQRLFYPLCKALNKDIGYFYEKIVFPLQKSGIHAFDLFNQAIFDFEKIIVPLNLDKEVQEAFEKELRSQFTPKPVKIKAIFELRCYSQKGIHDIKSIL